MPRRHAFGRKESGFHGKVVHVIHKVVTERILFGSENGFIRHDHAVLDRRRAERFEIEHPAFRGFSDILRVVESILDKRVLRFYPLHLDGHIRFHAVDIGKPRAVKIADEIYRGALLSTPVHFTFAAASSPSAVLTVTREPSGAFARI